MLLILAQWLQDDFGFFRVFSYITFRAVMATLTALLIGLAAGPWVIRKLAALKMGQAVRTDGPQTHLVKSGTPTMGGVLILIGIFVSCMLWADLSNRFIWIVMIVTFGFGAIGWVDDYRKVAHKDPKGMASREKFLWQTLIGLFAAIYLAFSVSEVNNLKVLQLFYEWLRSGFALDLPAKTNLLLPFIKEVSYPLGMMGFIILSYLVIVGSSNAVNLTDGLDGLVIMPVILVGAALGAWVAHAMFDLEIWQWSVKVRSGPAQWFAEAVATAGLLFVILRSPSGKASSLVACYIGAAYWFTASTSFANPAAAFGRMFSNTFAGISPADVPAFVVAQIIGGLAGMFLHLLLKDKDPSTA